MAAPSSSSLIDRVDGHDRPIGTVRRGRALSEGANFRTSHIFLFDQAGELLLQRLAPKRERHPGRWGSSVAAYLHSGETYRAAAERRVKEELGVSPKLSRVGKTLMHDGESVKFVSLYQGLADRVEICEPDHIGELRYWQIDELRQSLASAPSHFTPTFSLLLRTFLDR